MHMHTYMRTHAHTHAPSTCGCDDHMHSSIFTRTPCICARNTHMLMRASARRKAPNTQVGARTQARRRQAVSLHRTRAAPSSYRANFSTEEERLDRVLMMTHGVMVKQKGVTVTALSGAPGPDSDLTRFRVPDRDFPRTAPPIVEPEKGPGQSGRQRSLPTIFKSARGFPAAGRVCCGFVDASLAPARASAPSCLLSTSILLCLLPVQ